MREGHIYVIAYANEHVKVGCTKNPAKRLGDHARNAAIHGNAIVRTWVSDLHAAYRENEKALIGYCKNRWTTINSDEVFSRGDFNQIVEYARGLCFTRLTQAEIDAEDARLQRIAADLRATFNLKRRAASAQQAESKIELVAPLISDANRWAGTDTLFEILREMFSNIPAAWAATDPLAAEQHLVGLGATPEIARHTATTFEIDMRTLFAMANGREAEAFDEIAEFLANLLPEADA